MKVKLLREGFWKHSSAKRKGAAWEAAVFLSYESFSFQGGLLCRQPARKQELLNINWGYNKELLEHCRTLGEYARFVGKVKGYAKGMELSDAIGQAMDECIEEDILKDFLMKRRAEIMNTLLTEYDEERVLKDLSQEFYEDGFLAGKETGIAEGKAQGITEGKALGIAEGIASGKQELSKLLKKLLEENRLEDARRAVSDEAFQQLLIQEMDQ